MIWPVSQFICKVFYNGLKWPAYIRVIPQCPGYRGRVNIKCFRYIFYGNPAQNCTLDIKYKEFAHNNRLRNRLLIFHLNW